jgi:hypothetical protein
LQEQAEPVLLRQVVRESELDRLREVHAQVIVEVERIALVFVLPDLHIAGREPELAVYGELEPRRQGGRLRGGDATGGQEPPDEGEPT